LVLVYRVCVWRALISELPSVVLVAHPFLILFAGNLPGSFAEMLTS